jgi:EpsI family protein
MIKSSRFIVVYVLIMIAGLYINVHSDITVPMNKSFREFPLNLHGWKMESESIISDEVLKKLRPTDYVVRTYLKPGQIPVYLYIGFHSGGKGSGPIHSPKHCLPGAGWLKLKEDKVGIDVNSKRLNIVKAIFQKGESKELFLYWYYVRGRTLTSEYALKLAEISNSIVQRRRDSAFIRVSIPFESDEKQAFSSGAAFIKDVYPVIEEFLPQ